MEKRLMKRVSKDPKSATKMGLLSAAGALFAERGVDAVSLREITASAKANVAAVNYHFGSREGLVLSLLDLVMMPFWHERQVRMDLAEQKWGKKAVPLEELMDAWARSAMAVIGRTGLKDQVALGVIGRAILMPQVEWSAEVRLVSGSWVPRWQRFLQASLPGVKPLELQWRMKWLDGAYSSMLMDCGHSWQVGDLDAVCTAFARFAIAGMRAGLSGDLHGSSPGEVQTGQVTFDF